jgi:hypothetical protein
MAYGLWPMAYGGYGGLPCSSAPFQSARPLYHKKKGLSFISNRQRRNEGTFCASGLAGIEPTPPAPEEQGMRAFRQLG